MHILHFQVNLQLHSQNILPKFHPGSTWVARLSHKTPLLVLVQLPNHKHLWKILGERCQLVPYQESHS